MTILSRTDGPLENCSAYYSAYGRQEDSAGALLYRSGLGHPLYNGVMRWQGPDLDAAVTAARSRLADVPWFWWAGPDSSPGTSSALEARGAVRAGRMPVMGLVVTDRPTADPVPGVEVTTVRTAEDLDRWSQAYGQAFGLADHLTLPAERGRPASESLLRFAARVDGQVVGTAALLAAHGVAGVYVVGTHPEHRGRGIGTLMSQTVLQAGFDAGLRVATLQPSEQGEPVYRRLGFEEWTAYDLFTFPGTDPDPAP